MSPSKKIVYEKLAVNKSLARILKEDLEKIRNKDEVFVSEFSGFCKLLRDIWLRKTI